MKKYRTVFRVSKRIGQSLLGVQAPAIYVSVATTSAPSYSTMISKVVVGKGVGESATASPSRIFNELAIAANMLDDDGR